jgi:hypothetical protein
MLPALPAVGHWIESGVTHRSGFCLSLEVVSVTWRKNSVNSRGQEWSAEIELHIPRVRNWSIGDFYEWYAPKVGRSVSAFI